MKTRYDIVLPTTPHVRVRWPEDEQRTGKALELDELVCVTSRSYKRLQYSVWKIACLFRNEMNFAIPDYWHKGEAVGEDVRAYLWCKTCDEYPTGLGPSDVVIGGCCFYPHEDAWGLHWVWLHPFERRQGRLSRVWPYFEERFGSFVPMPPWSDAMRHFLKKQGYVEKLRKEHPRTGRR